MFILHKLFTREISFWKDIARERERSGISCCRLCAALGEHETCSDCQEFLADDNQYDWFKNAVLGRPPLQMKDLSDEEITARRRTLRETYPALREDITPRPHGFHNSYDGNVDWAGKLDFYSKLEEPFDNTYDLFLQWQKFNDFCREHHPYRSLLRDRKRKRSEEPSAENTADPSSGLNVSEKDSPNEDSIHDHEESCIEESSKKQSADQDSSDEDIYGTT
jgi:ketosteroid isomerase-like protein